MFRTDAATGERPGVVKKLRATPQTWNIPHAVRCSSILAMSCHDVKESHEASLGMLTSKWKSFSHKVWEWLDTSTVPPDPWSKSSKCLRNSFEFHGILYHTAPTLANLFFWGFQIQMCFLLWVWFFCLPPLGSIKDRGRRLRYNPSHRNAAQGQFSEDVWSNVVPTTVVQISLSVSSFILSILRLHLVFTGFSNLVWVLYSIWVLQPLVPTAPCWIPSMDINADVRCWEAIWSHWIQCKLRFSWSSEEFSNPFQLSYVCHPCGADISWNWVIFWFMFGRQVVAFINLLQLLRSPENIVRSDAEKRQET